MTASARAIICIDGIDGSGKSHLAARVVHEGQAAGVGAMLLRVDDFRRPIDWNQPGIVESEVYYDDYYDLARLDACLQAFRRGDDELEVPYFDPVAERIVEIRRRALAGVAVLVVEGVFVRRLPTAADQTTVYIATSFAEARRRIVARDTGRGRTLAEVCRRLDGRYVPSQMRYHQLFEPRERADVVVEHEVIGGARVIRADLTGKPAGVIASLGFVSDGLGQATISFSVT